MKCWKCGKNIETNKQPCPHCGTSQKRNEPGTEIGRVFRYVSDKYGCEAIFSNDELLIKNLNNYPDLQAQLKELRDAGVYKSYHAQLTYGNSDSRFRNKIINDVHKYSSYLSDNDIDLLMGYIDEMIGWDVIVSASNNNTEEGQKDKELEERKKREAEERKKRDRIRNILVFIILISLGFAIYAWTKPDAPPHLIGTPTPKLVTPKATSIPPTPTRKPTATSIPPTPTPKVTLPIVMRKGDRFYFGNYEQDNNSYNGKEPIQWRVLDVNGNYALVISQYVLDARDYNNTNTSVTWKTSDIRAWLNSTFYNDAFSSEEKKFVTRSSVYTSDNRKTCPDPNTGVDRPAGKDGSWTEDYMFFLDYDEAINYFSSEIDRQCFPTAYARAQRAFSSPHYNGTSWWWLRWPGNDNTWAANVSPGGVAYHCGTEVNYNGKNGKGGVRPAFWIRYK